MSNARKRSGHAIDERIFTFLQSVLLVDPPSYVAAEREKWLAFVMRWQQFTGRVMAKGVEDTAFYNFNRLVSMNEVGGDPGREPPFDGAAELHRRNEAMQRDWPHTLNATSTHDTKRSEDVRARIDVLSELAPDWMRAVRRWSKLAAKHRRNGAPSPSEELLIYQTLVGMWPFESRHGRQRYLAKPSRRLASSPTVLNAMTSDDVTRSEQSTVLDRLKQYLEKAAREAKTHTSWIAPNRQYEESLFAFAEGVINDDELRDDLLKLQRRVAFYGFLNSLAQVVVKIAAPGVPDFYQGGELWDLSLVDPDNRRPVDYERRRAMLEPLRGAKSIDLATMLRRFGDGRVKLYVTWKALELRTRRTALFRDGDYSAIEAGPNAFAFARGEEVVAIVPRFVSKLVRAGSLPLGAVWSEQTIAIPTGRWRNVFTGEELDGGTVRLANVFATFPVALLDRVDSPREDSGR